MARSPNSLGPASARGEAKTMHPISLHLLGDTQGSYYLGRCIALMLVLVDHDKIIRFTKIRFRRYDWFRLYMQSVE